MPSDKDIKGVKGVTHLESKPTPDKLVEDASPEKPKVNDAKQSALYARVTREHGAEGGEEFSGGFPKLANPKSS